MRGGVTDAGQPNIEDRATQPMEAGGRVLQFWAFKAILGILGFEALDGYACMQQNF